MFKSTGTCLCLFILILIHKICRKGDFNHNTTNTVLGIDYLNMYHLAGLAI